MVTKNYGVVCNQYIYDKIFHSNQQFNLVALLALNKSGSQIEP